MNGLPMVIDIPADRKIGKTSIEEVRVRLAHFFGNVLSEHLLGDRPMST